MRTFEVLLSNVLVGHILDDEEGRTAFRLDRSYLERSRRPVLGQAFEDDLYGTFEGDVGRLPTFFANLVPEGPVRELLVRSTGVPSRDDLGLLSAVGTDLPGAIVIRPSETQLEVQFSTPDDTPRLPSPDDPSGGPLHLRFSIAGVQMKFSVLKESERVVLPVGDGYGNWILKLDSASFPNLVENEYATMEWARASGFDVPRCEVVPADALPESIRRLDPPDRPAFLIERYDRAPTGRVHQEDMAQVLGLYPECKYGRHEQPECPPVSYTQLLSVIRGFGHDEYLEAIRRLALMVATGNEDAHLKNWSLVYPDGVRPTLSPLYDQVAIAAWRKATMHWALVWNGDRPMAKRTTLMTFSKLAERLGESGLEATDLVRETLDSLADSWSAVVGLYPAGHADAIRQYWREVPLLRPLKSRLA